MDNAALVGVHRLKHDASLVFENALCLTARKTAQSFFSLFAVARNVKSDLDVLTLFGFFAVLADLAAVRGKTRKVLERVKRLAVVPDEHTGVISGYFDNDTAVVAVFRVDLGFDAHILHHGLYECGGFVVGSLLCGRNYFGECRSDAEKALFRLGRNGVFYFIYGNAQLLSRACHCLFYRFGVDCNFLFHGSDLPLLISCHSASLPSLLPPSFFSSFFSSFSADFFSRRLSSLSGAVSMAPVFSAAMRFSVSKVSSSEGGV